MWIVLVTDFAAVNRVYGPFGTQAEAQRWAERALRDVYRVFPVNPAFEVTPDATPAPIAGDQLPD